MSKQNVDDEHAHQLPSVRIVNVQAPLQWLKLGWLDLKKSRFIGVVYGAIFVVMGFAIVSIYATRWQLTMGLIGGFLLLGPFLATGIYDLSRQLERNKVAKLLPSLTCWRNNLGAIALFAVILTFCMIVWARVSLIIFALTSTISFPTLQGVIGTIFSFDNLPFMASWIGVGSLFATLVFAISVVSIPMMLDRETDAVSAVFTSFRVLAKNPKPILVWAAIIAVIIGASLLFAFVGLLVTAPLIGHATWHAYRATVE